MSKDNYKPVSESLGHDDSENISASRAESSVRAQGQTYRLVFISIKTKEGKINELSMKKFKVRTTE